MNKITIIGNVVHTPEMRTTNSGANVCKFSVAVKRRFKNPQSGEYETDFFDVQAWSKLAELCEKYLEKGKKVAVVGGMQSREYEGRDGNKRRVWEVMADEVEFLSARNEAGEAAKPVAQVPQHPMSREEAKAAVKMAAALASDRSGFTSAEDEELPF